MGYFGIPFRNGVPIGLGSIVGFGAQQFDPSELFVGGTAGAWYDPSDLTTLFTTSAGTTQCAMPGQGSAVSVGLMLDKSQGLVLGSELVTNGTFDTNTNGWSASSGLTSATRDTTIFPAGGLKIVANGAEQSYATQTISGLTVGRQYVISTSAYTPSTNPTNNRATIGTQAGGFTTAGSIAQTSTNVIQTLTIRFFATSITQTIYCSVVATNFTAWGANGAEAYFDNISVRELPGNHAIAFNDTTARPELRARVNLLTYSEDFRNTAAAGSTRPWTYYNITSVVIGATSPTGSATANTITFSGTEGSSYTPGLSFVNALSYRYICYMKAGTSSFGALNVGTFGTYVSAVFDLANGIVGETKATGAGASVTSSSITSVGNNWYLCEMVFVATSSMSNLGIQRAPLATGNVFSGYGDIQGNTAGTTILVWGADLRPANIGANVPAYQRIADANTYDTSGFPLYLRFDGIDDSMYTPANLNLSGTDKVAVFAGVRKLADTQGSITELSATAATNNGSFNLFASVGGAARWFSALRGTALAYYEPQTYTAPITNVLSTSFDIAGASISNEIVPRVNGIVEQDNSSGTNAGTGNFGTYPLYIGSRNNSGDWFNGQVYGLLVVGSAVSAGNISATEQWVAGKTGITI